MTVWLIIGVVTALATGALLMPLFRRADVTVSREQRELAIYKDQLAELQRDVQAGRISPAEAAAAEAEVQRKMLASAARTDPAETPAASAMVNQVRLVAVVAVASLAPIGALLVYLSVGSPGEPGHPFVSRSQQVDVEAEALIARLADRLREEPNNLEGWVLLARSYSAIGRYVDAAQAYERVYDLSSGSVVYAGEYAEALVMAAGGQVGPGAQKLFEQVREVNPGEPRARYYLAVALAQSGNSREAIAMWRALEMDAPPDAPWLPAVREAIQSTAARAQIEPQTVAPAARAAIEPEPGPTEDDIAAAESMSAEEQQQMIEAMVARLAERLRATPDDLEGWKRLGRSYMVLNEPAKARDAYARAAAMAPTDLGVLADLAKATLQAPGAVKIPAESIGTLREALAANGADPTALWLMGLAAFDTGNKAEAEDLWRRLLAQLPPDSIAFTTVKARLDDLTASP
jgi:cytochrome c-type biogenesis protein CcmH